MVEEQTGRFCRSRKFRIEFVTEVILLNKLRQSIQIPVEENMSDIYEGNIVNYTK